MLPSSKQKNPNPSAPADAHQFALRLHGLSNSATAPSLPPVTSRREIIARIGRGIYTRPVGQDVPVKADPNAIWEVCAVRIVDHHRRDRVGNGEVARLVDTIDKRLPEAVAGAVGDGAEENSRAGGCYTEFTGAVENGSGTRERDDSTRAFDKPNETAKAAVATAKK